MDISSKPVVAAQYAALGITHGPKVGNQHKNAFASLLPAYLGVTFTGMGMGLLGQMDKAPDLFAAGAALTAGGATTMVSSMLASMVAETFWDATHNTNKSLADDKNFVTKCRQNGKNLFVAFSLATAVASTALSHNFIQENIERYIPTGSEQAQTNHLKPSR